MPRALNMVRYALTYRREVFNAGLRKAGYKIVDSLNDPKPDDVLVVWNRYGTGDSAAERFEAAGARVIVCENGLLGKRWQGDTWITMTLNHLAGAGVWRIGGPERWDDLQVAMRPFRVVGTEFVILGQRGIGEPGIAAPHDWADTLQRRIGGRVRPHPGNEPPTLTLEEDLKDAYAAITWNSGAALQALLLGVPVWYECETWIGAQAGTPLPLMGQHERARSSAQSRLAMFRRAAWAMWRLDAEIGTGAAFEHLLQRETVTA